MAAIDGLFDRRAIYAWRLALAPMRLHSRLVVSGSTGGLSSRAVAVGSRGPRDALSEETQRYLFRLLDLIDES